MKIKTITCHHVYNHGASLQAYALQAYLQKMGHEVEIIDYRPAYLDQRSRFLAISPRWRRKSWPLRWAYYGFQFPRHLRWHWLPSCQAEFDQFTKDHLLLTERTYRSVDELRSEPPEADLFVAGSDQIWNTAYWNGRDAAFFLDFGNPEAKRISYAASFGTSNLVPEFREFVREKLLRFDAISVREDAGLKILAELGVKNATHVVDPVFLLSSDEWAEMLEPVNKSSEKYLLVYDFEGSKAFSDFALELARQRGLKIYSVNNHLKTRYADRDFYTSGPKTFLSLIKGADLVLSNSFHATAFSLIFNREFLVVPRQKDGVNSRMESLLRAADMTDRMLNFPLSANQVASGSVALDESTSELENFIDRSKSFLKLSINRCPSDE